MSSLVNIRFSAALDPKTAFPQIDIKSINGQTDIAAEESVDKILGYTWITLTKSTLATCNQ